MDNKRIDELIHNVLLPAQQRLRSYEQLANGEYRFESKTFHKCVQTLQEVIDTLRQEAK